MSNANEIGTAVPKWAQENYLEGAMVLVVIVDGNASCISNLQGQDLVGALEEAVVRARLMAEPQGPPS